MIKILYKHFMKTNKTFSYKENANNFFIAFENGPKN